MPYLLLAVLVLGTGLGIGLGLSEAPVLGQAATRFAPGPTEVAGGITGVRCVVISSHSVTVSGVIHGDLGTGWTAKCHHSCFERREPVARTLQIPINRVWGLTQLLPVSESVTVLPDHRGYVWHPGGLFGRLVSLSVPQWLITNQPSAGGAQRSYNFLPTLRK